MMIQKTVLLVLLTIGNGVLVKNTQAQKEALPACLQKLVAAYPGQFKATSKNTIVWNDKTVMVFDDDIKNKSFQQLLDNADLEDQVCAMTYPRTNFTAPQKNSDPGRVRYEPFFKKMYGSTAQRQQ
jgi:hypothetical protein